MRSSWVGMAVLLILSIICIRNPIERLHDLTYFITHPHGSSDYCHICGSNLGWKKPHPIGSISIFCQECFEKAPRSALMYELHDYIKLILFDSTAYWQPGYEHRMVVAYQAALKEIHA